MRDFMFVERMFLIPLHLLLDVEVVLELLVNSRLGALFCLWQYEMCIYSLV